MVSSLLQQKLPANQDKLAVATQEILLLLKDMAIHRNQFLEALDKSFKDNKKIMDALAKL